jgi:hypothetical protein
MQISPRLQYISKYMAHSICTFAGHTKYRPHSKYFRKQTSKNVEISQMTSKSPIYYRAYAVCVLITHAYEECCLLEYEDGVWLSVRTDVSEEHITSIFRVKRLRVLLVRSQDVPQDGRGRQPPATAPSLSCLSVTVRL